jgi:hypothetical protein
MKGSAEQVGSPSKMARENWMSLDMILAEKGRRVMCPDWGQIMHIHPQQHSSGRDIIKAL